MNYLLHCWLGRSDPGLKAGGFLGDFVKGPLHDYTPETLARGLRLHRHIDVVSNRMSEMKVTYKRFGQDLRRPAPILLDLMADHVLAKNWDEFADEAHDTFAASCYRDIARFDIPASAARMFDHMRRTDLLVSYADANVMGDIMKRILKRLRFDDQLDQIDVILSREIEGFEEDFRIYFPKLEAEAESFILDLGASPTPFESCGMGR